MSPVNKPGAPSSEFSFFRLFSSWNKSYVHDPFELSPKGLQPNFFLYPRTSRAFPFPPPPRSTTLGLLLPLGVSGCPSPFIDQPPPPWVVLVFHVFNTAGCSKQPPRLSARWFTLDTPPLILVPPFSKWGPALSSREVLPPPHRSLVAGFRLHRSPGRIPLLFHSIHFAPLVFPR